MKLALVASVGLYIAASLTLSILRFEGFQASNFDLGLFQQSLWSQAHGRGFFEAADYEFAGATSLLAIHPSPLMYALEAMYTLAPSAVTLLTVQSVVVGLAAAPLFLLTSAVTRSVRQAFVTAVLYLLWAPTLTSNLFDFHLEAFLPLELFTLAWLWQTRRLVVGGAVAIVAFASIEVAPALVFLLGAFFLLELARRNGDPPAQDGPGGRPRRELLRQLGERLWSDPGRRRFVVATLLLMTGALAALVLLLRWESTFPSLLERTSMPGLTGILQGGPPQLQLSPALFVQALASKIEFWLVVYALVAFVPVLAPRTAIVAVPWVAATLFAAPKFTVLGNQYGLIAAFPVFLGVAYGIGPAFRLLREHWAVGPRVSPGSGTSEVLPRGRRSRAGIPWPTLALVVVVAGANLSLSPLDPWLSGPDKNPGFGNGYLVTWGATPAFDEVQRLVGLLPVQAPVIASDNLFPFVANDANAFAFYYAPDPPIYLPFNASRPPPNVLVSETQLPSVPPWLVRLLANASTYGLRAAIAETPVGIVQLFQLGYRGAPLELGTGRFPTITYEGTQLGVGAAGELASDPNRTFPFVIDSVQNATGNVWYGPYAGLVAGAYTVDLLLRFGWTGNLTGGPSVRPVFEITSGGFATSNWYDVRLPIQPLHPGALVTFEFGFYLTTPVPRCEVRGYVLDPHLQVELVSVTISENPGSP